MKKWVEMAKNVFNKKTQFFGHGLHQRHNILAFFQ